jgi:hypothetical protein
LNVPPCLMMFRLIRKRDHFPPCSRFEQIASTPLTGLAGRNLRLLVALVVLMVEAVMGA